MTEHILTWFQSLIKNKKVKQKMKHVKGQPGKLSFWEKELLQKYHFGCEMKSWQKLKEKRMLDQNSGGAGSSSGAMMKTEWMEGKEPQPSEKEKETIVTKWRKNIHQKAEVLYSTPFLLSQAIHLNLN